MYAINKKKKRTGVIEIKKKLIRFALGGINVKFLLII